MSEEPLIIIGGGIAGLVAAKKLSSQNKRVILLEARDRLGGRIFTLEPASHPDLVMECGAEFIHGELPLTLGLLKEYGISYYQTAGRMVDLSKEKRARHDDAKWEKLMQSMAELKTDLTLSEFLAKFFPGKHNDLLRARAEGFAGGFDLADPATASTRALHREWDGEFGRQYRIEGGYQKMVDALQADCKKKGCEIFLSSVTKNISWRPGHVTATTASGKSYTGSKVLITIPAGIWQTLTGEGFIHFDPAIPGKIDAFQSIGYGGVIKILLDFSHSFWNTDYQNLGFFLTGNQVPTWWTQEPKKTSLLTGWVGAKEAAKWEKETDDAILSAAIDSLSLAFDQRPAYLREILTSAQVLNWNRDPFSKGGYCFSTLDTARARAELSKPDENTLFFAGEALYEGRLQGTVEAALHNGLAVAEKMAR